MGKWKETGPQVILKLLFVRNYFKQKSLNSKDTLWIFLRQMTVVKLTTL